MVAGSRLADRILAFDADTGLLHAEAGFSLDQLYRVFLPRGWFTPVTPGTRFVTLGGMVAADVHGKNHHRDGCIGEHVQQLTLRVADGRIVACSQRARTGAVPRHAGRHGADRSHSRGDAAARARAVTVDRPGIRAHTRHRHLHRSPQGRPHRNGR